MKCKIPEISWHNRDPVLSVHIQPHKAGEPMYRLATGGTDAHLLIWYLRVAADDSDIEIEMAADLTRHQRAINTVKFSPNGDLLASGDDESVVFIWKLKPDSDIPNLFDPTRTDQNKETWTTLKVLRGHMEDVYDLSWSPNSQYLVSGSVDNSAIIWDVHKGKSLAILSDHKGFVQGVAWDPFNRYIATLCTDRYLRIFDIQTKRVLHRINKSVVPVPKEHDLHGRRMHIFHDDTLQTYFRRLCFTPDGKMLFTPAGVTDMDGSTPSMHTTYGFNCHNLRQPAVVLPCPHQYTVAVSCCPMIFSLRPHNPATNPPIIALPYRMIFAVATRSSVYFYDTQQLQPFAIISNIHYTRLTDITWNSDGRIVVVSSTDGFCSIITFEKNELGEKYEGQEEVVPAADNEMSCFVKKAKKHKDRPTQQVSPHVRAVGNKKVCIENVMKADKQKLEKHIKENSAEMSASLQLELRPSDMSTNLEQSENKLKLTTSAIISIEEKVTKHKGETPEKKSYTATPIAIRRFPRAVGTQSTVEHLSTNNNVNVLNENSLLDEKSVAEKPRLSEQNENLTANNAISKSDISGEMNKVDMKSDLSTNLTPRRVALTTISSPKTKKKSNE